MHIATAESPKTPISLPTQGIKKFMAKIELGSRKEAASPEFTRSVLAEMLLTFLFVFGGVAAAMAANKIGGGAGQETITGLTAVAIAQAMLVAVMIAVGFDVSAGHLNPAVTIAFAGSGHVTVFRCSVYVAAQLMASASACLLLKYITGGLEVPVSALGGGLSPAQGVVMEAVLTFSMVLTVYAVVVSPRSGVFSGLAPVLVGLVVGANTLAGGPFSGASMNPARSFGPALASWNWADHWVYWAGPLIGSSLAGFVYDQLFLARARDAALLLPDDEEA